MPEDLIATPIAEGRLVSLPIADDRAGPDEPLIVHAAHLRDRPLGPAARWLLDDLRTRCGADRVEGASADGWPARSP